MVVINPPTDSVWTYSPYVPLQITSTTLDMKKKQIPSIDLYSDKQNKYNLAIGKSYEFTLNYAKMSRYEESNDFSSAYRNEEQYVRAAIRRHLYEFTIGQKIFISEITETINGFYYMSEHSNIASDDYDLTLVETGSSKTFPFTATELLTLIEQKIIKEL